MTSWAGRTAARMRAAAEECHLVIVKYANGTPQVARVLYATGLELELQYDVYLDGSRSLEAVARKAKLAKAFFRDCETFRWMLKDFDAWRTAAWVKGKVCGGQKSAGSSAIATLRLVGAATGTNTFALHTLVRGQRKSLRSGAMTQETQSLHKSPPWSWSAS